MVEGCRDRRNWICTRRTDGGLYTVPAYGCPDDGSILAGRTIRRNRALSYRPTAQSGFNFPYARRRLERTDDHCWAHDYDLGLSGIPGAHTACNVSHKEVLHESPC